MTKIHLILNKKALIGGLLKISTFFFFFGIFSKKQKIYRTFWYHFYPNRIKKKVSVIILVFLFGWCFFAEKANPYEKKSKK